MKSKKGMLSVENVITLVTKWSSFVAAVAVALVMLIATVDVILAKLFAIEVPGGKNFIAEFNVIIVFLGIAYVAHERGHIRLNIIERWIPDRLALAFKLLGYVLGILVIGFCAWRGGVLVLDSYAQHLYRYAAIDFPVWPFQTPIVFGCTFFTITFIMLFVKEIRAYRRGQAQSYPR